MIPFHKTFIVIGVPRFDDPTKQDPLFGKAIERLATEQGLRFGETGLYSPFEFPDRSNPHFEYRLFKGNTTASPYESIDFDYFPAESSLRVSSVFPEDKVRPIVDFIATNYLGIMLQEETSDRTKTIVQGRCMQPSLKRFEMIAKMLTNEITKCLEKGDDDIASKPWFKGGLDILKKRPKAIDQNKSGPMRIGFDYSDSVRIATATRKLYEALYAWISECHPEQFDSYRRDYNSLAGQALDLFENLHTEEDWVYCLFTQNESPSGEKYNIYNPEPLTLLRSVCDKAAPSPSINVSTQKPKMDLISICETVLESCRTVYIQYGDDIDKWPRHLLPCAAAMELLMAISSSEVLKERLAGNEMPPTGYQSLHVALDPDESLFLKTLKKVFIEFTNMPPEEYDSIPYEQLFAIGIASEFYFSLSTTERGVELLPDYKRFWTGTYTKLFCSPKEHIKPSTARRCAIDAYKEIEGICAKLSREAEIQYSHLTRLMYRSGKLPPGNTPIRPAQTTATPTASKAATVADLLCHFKDVILQKIDNSAAQVITGVSAEVAKELEKRTSTVATGPIVHTTKIASPDFKKRDSCEMFCKRLFAELKEKKEDSLHTAREIVYYMLHGAKEGELYYDDCLVARRIQKEWNWELPTFTTYCKRKNIPTPKGISRAAKKRSTQKRVRRDLRGL